MQHYTPDPEDKEDTSAYDHVTGHITHDVDELDLYLDELDVFIG